MRWFVGVSVACALAPSLAGGQTIRGTVSGTVTDPTAAVVSGARVSLRHVDTGIATGTVSDQAGRYTIPLLPPGAYQATVEKDGFRTSVRDPIPVRVAQTTRVDFSLELGGRAERVQVVGGAPLVSSTTAELGQVIERERIQALPLNGRLFEQLISLTPGAVARGFGDFAENPAAAGARSAIHHSVNGMPWSGNSYLLDGVVDNEPLNAFINITPPLEAIQEFKVQTSNPTAEFGVFGGAVVNLTIRSGTNEFHGSAFEYLRDESLNARSYFAPDKAPFSSHQFGATVGGPLVANSAFFFADYQGLRLDQGRTQTLTVPTLSMREGVFTEVEEPLYDPLTGEPFPGNVIPAGRMSPISRRVADVWPRPNRPGLVDNYVENNVVRQDVDAFDVRLDFRIGARASLFTRYSLARRRYDEPAPGNVFMGANNSESRNDNAVLGYTHAFGSSTFYEARLGYNRYDLAQRGEDHGIDKSNELGIPNGNLPGHPETSGIAAFAPSGFSATGSPGYTNSVRIGTTVSLTSNVSWIRDRHSLKAGGEVRLIRATLTNPETQPRGIFVFDRLYTSRAGEEGTGHSFASFLLGYPNRVRRDLVDTYPEVGRTFLGLFVQDDFRVSPELTLQLGLRWDLMTPPVEAEDRQSNFSLADGLIHLATPGDRGPGLETRHGYFAPRLGLAYSPDGGRTALRAAFGLSYFADNFGANGGTNERNYPFFREVDLVSPTPFEPFRDVADGLPALPPVPRAGTLAPPEGFAVSYMPRHFHEVRAAMWNVGIQRDLGWSTMVDVSYVGTRGRHLFRGRNINVPLPGPGPLPERRPYRDLAPAVAVINERDGDGRSWYDALQVKVDRRFSGGFGALVSYTYSRTEDTAFILHPALDEVRSPARDQAVDVPHVLAFGFTWELPFGPGKPLLAERAGLARALVEGWQLSAITAYQSGDPLNVLVAAPQLNTGTDNWPDVTCARIGRPGEVDRWFDTACFADPAPFEFGNYRIGDVRGPAVFNTDLSVVKKNAIGRTSLELRVDVFNLFDRAHFANPGEIFGTGQFGRISDTRLPPREVQLGLRWLF